MENLQVLERAKIEGWTDEEIITRVKDGETALYEIIMRRYNQRLYRLSRAIVRSDAEAEDVIQDAYVKAYQHLNQFAGEAPFSAWLTRITVNEALARIRFRNRNQQLDDTEQDGEISVRMVEPSLDPEQRASTTELGQLLEEAVLSLPEHYRTVVMLRDIEELSVSETAAALSLAEPTVKVRLHRGRALLKGWFVARIGQNAKNAFPFMGTRCDRVVANVFLKIAELHPEYSEVS